MRTPSLSRACSCCRIARGSLRPPPGLSDWAGDVLAGFVGLQPGSVARVADRLSGLQAIGGSMLNPVAMSIIANTFTDKAGRAKAIGMWGSVAGLSLASGPVLGGVLVSGIGWRSIFWINIPVGLIAIALTGRFVPESRAEFPRRLDPSGQLMIIALLGCLTAGSSKGRASVGARCGSSPCSRLPSSLGWRWSCSSPGGVSR